MNSKMITIIVSDLHLGGGKGDSGDDHVYEEAEFRKFLDESIPESKMGKVELFINGDFLDFAQVQPEVYTLGSNKYWCSEKESYQKLEVIINGHKDIFEALKEFNNRGNKITIAAGNHDVDLCWKDVQERIEKEVGNIEFGLGKEWFYRYNDRLMISHGHMLDPANKFNRWGKPIINFPDGSPRLEMCPGTLFMVKFVTWLKNQYPFAGNVKPISSLARLLYTEDRPGFKVAAWALLKFAGGYPIKFLGARGASLETAAEIGEQIIYQVDSDQSFANNIKGLFHEMGNPKATIETVRNELNTEKGVLDFLSQLIIRVNPDRWMPVFDISDPVVLSIDDDANVLAIIRSGMANIKENYREEGISQLANTDGEIVVFGHTHQPDEWRGEDGKLDGGYFNPGSWTRYVDISELPNLTLDDLKQKVKFPYQLNYIRIEASSTSNLRADKICYKSQPAKLSP